MAFSADEARHPYSIPFDLEIGSGGGTRTPDTRIMIPLL
jgi:hypothetical protein